MTYCVGMKCEQGLIAIADTRLTSGTAVSTGKKIAVHQDGDHAMFVLTSGLRSVRDKAITYFEERLAEHEMSLDRMYKAANMLAGEIRRVYMEDEEWLRRSGLIFDLNCIIGGQMSGDTEHHLYQIYPKGNWIEVGEGSPHAIIGEGSYGKVILDRSWHYDSRLDRGLLVGLLSFDATQTSASAVGPPVDTLVYHRGTYQMTEHRFTAEDLAPIAAQWGGAIEAAVEQAMPTIAWHAGALGIQTGPDGAAGWPTVAGNPMFPRSPSSLRIRRSPHSLSSSRTHNSLRIPSSDRSPRSRLGSSSLRIPSSLHSPRSPPSPAEQPQRAVAGAARLPIAQRNRFHLAAAQPQEDQRPREHRPAGEEEGGHIAARRSTRRPPTSDPVRMPMPLPVEPSPITVPIPTRRPISTCIALVATKARPPAAPSPIMTTMTRGIRSVTPSDAISTASRARPRAFNQRRFTRSASRPKSGWAIHSPPAPSQRGDRSSRRRPRAAPFARRGMRASPRTTSTAAPS